MLLNKTGPILQAEKSVPREKDILQDDSGFSKPGNAFGGFFFFGSILVCYLPLSYTQAYGGIMLLGYVSSFSRSSCLCMLTNELL